MQLPLGSISNVICIVVGSLAGMAMGNRFPGNIREIVFQCLGFTIFLVGMSMALHVDNVAVLLVSMLVGGLAGELLRLEDRFNALGEWVKAQLKSRNAKFTDGFVAASLIYCIGSMAIVGALDEGLRGDHSVLLTKAILDGFISVVLASTYGSGVMFSAVPVFLYQFGITLFAVQFRDVFSPELVTALTAQGGTLILGIGINLLELRYIKISNLLPSLAVAAVLVTVF